MKACNEYFTAKELREVYRLPISRMIPNTERFILCTGNPHPDNKVATLVLWILNPKHGRGLGWLY